MKSAKQQVPQRSSKYRCDICRHRTMRLMSMYSERQRSSWALHDHPPITVFIYICLRCGVVATRRAGGPRQVARIGRKSRGSNNRWVVRFQFQRIREWLERLPDYQPDGGRNDRADEAGTPLGERVEGL